MKWLDNQGKLFGKLNILDLLLIIILLGAVAFAGLKFIQSSSDGGDQTIVQKTVTYVVYNSNSHPFVLENIQIGDEMTLLTSNSKMGTVVDMEIGQAFNLVTTADGRMVESEVPNKEEVYLTLEVKAPLINGVATIDGTQLLVGNNINLKGPNYMLPVLISEVSVGD